MPTNLDWNQGYNAHARPLKPYFKQEAADQPRWAEPPDGGSHWVAAARPGVLAQVVQVPKTYARKHPIQQAPRQSDSESSHRAAVARPSRARLGCPGCTESAKQQAAWQASNRTRTLGGGGATRSCVDRLSRSQSPRRCCSASPCSRLLACTRPRWKASASLRQAASASAGAVCSSNDSACAHGRGWENCGFVRLRGCALVQRRRCA